MHKVGSLLWWQPAPRSESFYEQTDFISAIVMGVCRDSHTYTIKVVKSSEKFQGVTTYSNGRTSVVEHAKLKPFNWKVIATP